MRLGEAAKALEYAMLREGEAVLCPTHDDIANELDQAQSAVLHFWHVLK